MLRQMRLASIVKRVEEPAGIDRRFWYFARTSGIG